MLGAEEPRARRRPRRFLGSAAGPILADTARLLAELGELLGALDAAPRSAGGVWPSFRVRWAR